MSNNLFNENPIAFCGLYCDNCGKFKNGKCPGCEKNEKATWCTIRKCCIEKNISSCADCTEIENMNECKKYNNVFSKVIQFVTRTDRAECIYMIQSQGREAFINHMQELQVMSLPKKKK